VARIDRKCGTQSGPRVVEALYEEVRPHVRERQQPDEAALTGVDQ
jgi:hypothetical protein